MEITDGKKLTIFLSEGKVYGNVPLYEAILAELSRAGIRLVAANRASAGYGRSAEVHTASIEVLSVKLPIVIEAVDVEERIEAVIPVISEIAEEALIEVMRTKLIRPAEWIEQEERGSV